jgi:hypothetical protein
MTLERRLTKIKSDFFEYCAELEAAAEFSELATINDADEGDDEQLNAPSRHGCGGTCWDMLCINWL